MLDMRDHTAELGSVRAVLEYDALRQLRLPVLIGAVVGLTTLAIGLKLRAPVIWAFPQALFSGLAVIAILGWEPLRLRGTKVILHWYGAVLEVRGRQSVMSFDEVEELWFDLDYHQGSYMPDVAIFRSLELVAANRKRLRLPVSHNGEAAVRVINHIVRQCSDRVFANARTIVRDGGEASFGRVRVSNEGIRVGKRFGHWSRIRKVTFRSGSFTLFGAVPFFHWSHIRLTSVPNAWALMELVRMLAPKIEDEVPWGGRSEQ